MIKKQILILFLAAVSSFLNACNPEVKLIPEMIEVSRIVEQATAPSMTPKPTQYQEAGYEIKSEHFDATIALVQHYNDLSTKQCEAYYESFSEEARLKNSKEDQILFCQKGIENVEIISILPYNLKQNLSGEIIVLEPENTLYFEAHVNEYYLLGPEGAKTERMLEVIYYITVIPENGKWKIDSSATSPFQND